MVSTIWHVRTTAILIGLSALIANNVQAQFGKDGEGFLLPMCVTWAHDSAEAQQFLTQQPEEMREILGRKPNRLQCNALVPKPIIESCKAWLRLSKPSGVLPENSFRQAFDAQARAMLNDDASLAQYHACLDEK